MVFNPTAKSQCLAPRPVLRPSLFPELNHSPLGPLNWITLAPNPNLMEDFMSQQIKQANYFVNCPECWRGVCCIS